MKSHPVFQSRAALDGRSLLLRTLSCHFLAILALVACLPSSALGQARKNDRQASKKPTANAYPPEFESARREVYKVVDDVQLSLFIFQPDANEADKPRPAIVFFFGGGWTSGTPKQFEQHCLYLAERGMVAIAADYRVASRHQVKAVDCVRDGQSAIAWVREHADQLNVDSEKIVAAGGSAGGHIAACTALLENLNDGASQSQASSHPNALALFNPAVVLAPVEGHDEFVRINNIEDRLGVSPEKLSPFHHINKNSPPTIIFHGTGDTTVPFWTVEEFTKKMKENGVRCELKSFAEQPHGFFNYGRGNSGHYLSTLRQLDQFLVSLGYLKPLGRPQPYASVDDVEGLPRVLLIGDSISIGYTLPTRQLLKGIANVHRPAENCGPTIHGLEKLDQWLGEKEWDVIHFNFGLHDLKYMGPKGENLADPSKPENHPQVPLQEYEQNLRELVGKLKQTGAKLIWRNTTPVPPGSKGRVVGDDEKYNAVAEKVMKEHGIKIHDMYSFVLPNMNQIMLNANVHFTDEGYDQLAGEVAGVIRKTLADGN